MSPRRYQFNKETLSYTLERRGWRWYVGLVLKYILAGLALAVLVYVLFSFFGYTPSERRLVQERARLDSAVADLNGRYDRVSVVLSDLETRDRSIYQTLFDAEPSLSEAEAAEQAVTDLYQQLAEDGAGALMHHTTMLLQRLDTLRAVQAQRFDSLMLLVNRQGAAVRHIPSVQPVDRGKQMSMVASFGRRIHPFYKVLRMHTGVDYALPVGSPVYATADGAVKTIKRSQRGYGNMVQLSHGADYATMYAHLSSIDVRIGQSVRRGDVIGAVGNSGLSLAPHLHYEVHFKGKPVSPLHYFFGELSPSDVERIVRNVSQRGQALD